MNKYFSSVHWRLFSWRAHSTTASSLDQRYILSFLTARSTHWLYAVRLSCAANITYFIQKRLPTIILVIWSDRFTPYQRRGVAKLDNGSTLTATCQINFLCVIDIMVFIWKGSGKKRRRPIHEFSHRSRAMGPEPKKISTWNLNAVKDERNIF
jgi:hypothetical protein